MQGGFDKKWRGSEGTTGAFLELHGTEKVKGDSGWKRTFNQKREKNPLEKRERKCSKMVLSNQFCRSEKKRGKGGGWEVRTIEDISVLYQKTSGWGWGRSEGKEKN